MYRTVNELLNVNSNNLPDCESTVELANNFSDYFLGKVDKIRRELDANASASSRDAHQNLNLLWIDLNQVHLIGPVERNILVFKSSKSDVPLQSYGF